MNIKHIVLGFFAAAAVLVGCQPQEEDFGVAKIEVSTTSLTFGPSSGSQTLQVTASREWTVTGLPDWIAVDPAGAGPSKSPQTVTVTVIANDGYDREADIAFSIGLMKEYVKVSQTGQKGQIDYGKGTLEHPFSVDGVISYINALDNPSNDSPEKVYVKGIISAIGEEYNSQFGNGTFDISDDGTTSGTQFKIYRAKYLGNKNFTSKDTQIKVGDEVIVYGNVVLYGSSAPVYETSQGNAYLYSLNGVTGSTTPAGDPKGNGSKDDPFNVAAALKVVEGLGWTSNDSYERVGPFYVKGKISRIADKGTFTDGGTYGNASFYISDDGLTDNEFYCYRILYLGNKKFVAGQTDVKVGDEVIIYGELMNYRGNTPETVQGTAHLYSLNGETGGETPPTPPAGDPKGTGTLDDPYNPAGAANAVKDLTWTSNDTYDATGEVYVKGKISRIAEKGTFTDGGTYGNASFYISEDGTSAGEFYCYRVLYLGNKKFEAGQTDIKVGDEVVIYGQLMNYRNDTPETVSGKAYLYSLNGDTGSDTPPTPPTPPSGDPKGTGTLDDPYNPLGAVNAVKDLTWTSNDTYDATGDVYVKGKISRIASNGTFTEGGTYGNASFYISEDGSQDGEFYCFRVLYLGNKKFEAGQTDIKVGDEVVIYGQLMNYRNDTPETVSGKAYLYSLNGKTEDGGDTPPTPPTPPSGDPSGTGTLNDPYNPAAAINAVKDLTWTDNSTYDKTDNVYVKGKISRIASKGTFTEGGTYGNASFYISADGSESGEFYCFRVLYLGNKKFESGQTDIKVGDEVVIYGQLMNYHNDTPETVANSAYLYSLNGKTEDEGGGGQGGGGEQQGNVVTVDFTAQGYTNAEVFEELTIGDIKITADKGTNSTTPKYYNTGTAIRLYGSNTMTVKSNGKNIQKIEFTFGSGEGTNEITVDKGTWASPTWTGDASSVVFTVGGTSGHRRVQKLVITLAE